jgi:hypothetical protein
MDHRQTVATLLGALGKRYPAADVPAFVAVYRGGGAVRYSLHGGVVRSQRVPRPTPNRLYPLPRFDFRRFRPELQGARRIPYLTQSAPLAGEKGVASVQPDGNVLFEREWIS